MKQNDFRVPVEYIIGQYWRKKHLKDKLKLEDDYDDTLPEYPVDIIKNDKTNKVEKIIYDKDGKMEWSEELLRDFYKKVTRIKITLPNKDIFYLDLIRDENKVIRIEVN